MKKNNASSVDLYNFIHVQCSLLVESRDSTRTSRTTRKTVVTFGSIGTSRDVLFFSKIKRIVISRVN